MISPKIPTKIPAITKDHPSTWNGDVDRDFLLISCQAGYPTINNIQTDMIHSRVRTTTLIVAANQPESTIESPKKFASIPMTKATTNAPTHANAVILVLPDLSTAQLRQINAKPKVRSTTVCHKYMRTWH